MNCRNRYGHQLGNYGQQLRSHLRIDISKPVLRPLFTHLKMAETVLRRMKEKPSERMIQTQIRFVYFVSFGSWELTYTGQATGQTNKDSGLNERSPSLWKDRHRAPPQHETHCSRMVLQVLPVSFCPSVTVSGDNMYNREANRSKSSAFFTGNVSSRRRHLFRYIFFYNIVLNLIQSFT